MSLAIMELLLIEIAQRRARPGARVMLVMSTMRGTPRNAAATAVKMNGVMFSSRIRSQSSQVAIPIGARGSLHEFASTLQTMALTSSPSTVRIAVKCSPLFTTWPRTVLRAAHEFHFGSNLTVLTLVRDKCLSHLLRRLLAMRNEASDSAGSCSTDSACTDFRVHD